MDIPIKTLKNGFSLPVYGMGTFGIGGRREIDTSHDKEDVENLQRALEMGITHFDTAEGYAAGHSEELLGQAIRNYPRDKLTIVTKVSAWNQSYEGIKRACEASLRRLGLDYIDLYLLHRYPEPGISITETMKAMDELVAQGTVKNIGVSNMTVNRFKEAQKHTANRLACNQVHYNVQHREVEGKGIVKFCQDNDVFLVAYQPIQRGELPESPLVDELAKKYGKTPIQIAINWLISQSNVVTICKSSNPEHLTENLGAVGWELEPSEVEQIREEFPDQQSVSNIVPLNYPAGIAP